MYDYDTCSESVLVKRARKKDVKAFAKLYENVYKELYYFALYMMKNPQDAEDAVSEAVLSAYENICSLRKEEAFRGWIFKILSNVCKKKLKVKSRQETFEQQDSQKKSQSMQQNEQEEMLDVQNAWEILTEEERKIIAWSVFGGYNSKEVGEMLAESGESMNANTVRSKRSRALEKLKKRLC